MSECARCKHPHERRVPCDSLVPLPTAPRRGILCDCRVGAALGVAARSTIPVAIRKAVIERDGTLCQLCGRATLSGRRAIRNRRKSLHLDHIVPYSLGGADTAENLRVTCASCNTRRGNRTD